MIFFDLQIWFFYGWENDLWFFYGFEYVSFNDLFMGGKMTYDFFNGFARVSL